jgi:hypothetical protein
MACMYPSSIKQTDSPTSAFAVFAIVGLGICRSIISHLWYLEHLEHLFWSISALINIALEKHWEKRTCSMDFTLEVMYFMTRQRWGWGNVYIFEELSTSHSCMTLILTPETQLEKFLQSGSWIS